MIGSKTKSPKSTTKAVDVWGELDKVCRKLHSYLYGKQDKASAKRYQARLEKILERLPANDSAILREEGAALLGELKSDIGSAISHRRREIELMTAFQASVRDSVAAGEYDAAMEVSILAGRDAAALAERQAILHGLEKRMLSQKKALAIPNGSKRGNGKRHDR